MADDQLISRSEVLAGLPAKRAQTLLFLIESRTAHLVARSRVEFAFTDANYQQENAFLSAFSLGHKPPLRPTIQQLERYAQQWNILVPENPRLRAALTQVLSQKYNFTRQTVPQIRAALGTDTTTVQQAYYRLYAKPLSTVFAPRLSLWEQLRWNAAAIAQGLESFPPFWLACLITIALGLPQAFLALPIAVADVGPLATLLLIVIIGAINILTMACMAEAIGRSGDFRYGNALIKQLAANYLGNAGAYILSLAVGIRVFLIALACYIGLSVTLANLSQISAEIWAVFLFGTGLFLLTRRSLNFTVAVMVLLAGINISLLLLLSLLALPHIQLENLLYINLPGFQGQAFAPQQLQQIFGVSLMLYFGHIYVGECAKLVLPKDPSAKSLIWGSIVGTATLTVLYCLWVLAVNGAVAPSILAAESGTALEPLAKQVGAIATVLGALLIVLLLGMAWLRSSSLLVNLAREWLPTSPRLSLVLPAQQGRLCLRPRSYSGNDFRLGLTYLRLVGSLPLFRLDVQSGGKVHHLELAIAQRWELKQLSDHISVPQRGVFCIEVQSASEENVQLHITSSLVISYEGELDVEINSTSSPQLNRLKERSLWRRLRLFLQERQHFCLCISPLVLVLLITEWLFFTGTQSFTSVLSIAGILGNSLVGGIFPVLLLISSRRKGEFVPGVVLQILTQPLLLIGIYSFFLTTLLLHGLFIWQHPAARVTAISTAVLSVVITLVMQRSGAFTARTIVELREEQASGRTIFRITTSGRPQTTAVCLSYATGEQHYQAATVEIPTLASLQSASFQLPNRYLYELRVWAHRGKNNSDSESLPVLLEIIRGSQIMEFDLKLSGGKVLLPLFSDTSRLQLKLPEPSCS